MRFAKWWLILLTVTYCVYVPFIWRHGGHGHASPVVLFFFVAKYLLYYGYPIVAGWVLWKLATSNRGLRGNWWILVPFFVLGTYECVAYWRDDVTGIAEYLVRNRPAWFTWKHPH